MPADPYQVTITMGPDTVQSLTDSGFSLFMFVAVGCPDKRAQPLVWASTNEYSTSTQVTVPVEFRAYTLLQDPGTGPVVPGFARDIDPGETLVVSESSGTGTVERSGTSDAITIDNKTQTAMYCGISEPGANGFAPVCVVPLHGGFRQPITPLPIVLLVFSNTNGPVGGPATTAGGPCLLLDLGQNAQPAVSFDIDGGWDWGEQAWGISYPDGAELTTILLNPTAFS